MDVQSIRRLALSFRGATEEPHFHFTSFRIEGRIFATMPPDKALLHVFVPESEREQAVTTFPAVCEALHWGKRVVGVRIDLDEAPDSLVGDLLRAAYESKAAAKSRRS